PSSDHWKFCEKVIHRSDVDADSIHCSLDLVCSNTTLVHSGSGPSDQEKEVNDRNLATYLKAFALIYVLPEVDWTAEKVDMLLAEGTDLFRDSSETDEDQVGNKLSLHETYSDEKRIKRKFNLEGHTFTLALEPRYLGDVSKHTIKNLRRLLQKFFTSSRYCLLLTRVGNLLIWRRRKVFFVMRVKGKQRDKSMGLTMLLCLKSLDHVVNQARNLSGLRPRDEFSIRELVVVHLETPDGRVYIRDSSYRPIELKVANRNYAYLKSTLHLSPNQHDSMTNRSSLMVAVGSIMASKVYHPTNWNTNMLDRLVCYGLELSRNCWSDCLRDQRPVDLDTFPTQLRLGQFVLELKLVPNVKTGHWKCGIPINGTSFETHIKEAFRKYCNVVFQIDNQMYAMWAKDDFYYLFDPYEHSVMGTHTEKDKLEGAKWATLRMFRDDQTLLSVFHQVLKESNRQSTYYLHAVRIRNLAECPEGFALAPVPDEVDTLDVESLNEAIVFSDQPGVNVSEKFIKEISEYEEEERLRCLLERRRAEEMEAKKNAIPTTKPLKSKTKIVKNAKRCQNAKKSTATVLEPKKTDTKSLLAGKKSAIVVQKPENKSQKPKQSSTRRIKSRKSPRIPPNSVDSNVFSRQKGGSLSGSFPALPKSGPGRIPNVKWSTKECPILKIGDASLKASELKILTKVGHSIRKDDPKTQSVSIFPQKVGSDVPKPSKRLEVALNNEELKTSKRKESLLRFPGFNRVPQLLAVAGSESGTAESVNRMLGSAFKVANRVFAMTPWGNYVIFRHSPKCTTESAASWFYLFDGCTCDIDRFRHLDLSKGTAGLVAFRKLSDVVCHITDLRDKRALKMLRNRMKEEERLHRDADN
ncbi:hypothetical protein KR054_010307, partial [Drosophila jambulina]